MLGFTKTPSSRTQEPTDGTDVTTLHNTFGTCWTWVFPQGFHPISSRWELASQAQHERRGWSLSIHCDRGSAKTNVASLYSGYNLWIPLMYICIYLYLQKVFLIIFPIVDILKYNMYIYIHIIYRIFLLTILHHIVFSFFKFSVYFYLCFLFKHVSF